MKRIAYVILFVGVILSAQYLHRTWRVTESTLDAFVWAARPPLVSISQLTRNEQIGMLFIRLTDGLEQLLGGEWTTFPSQSGAYIVSYPTGDDTPQQMYHVSPEKIHEVNLVGITGVVSQVVEHTNGILIAVAVSREGGTDFCIAKDLLSTSPRCQTVSTNKKTEARWHPDTDNQLVLLTDEQEIFILSRDTGSMSNVSDERSADEYARLKQLFDPIDSDVMNQRIRFFGPLIVLGDSFRTSWPLFMPMFVRDAVLLDADHAIVRDSDEMGVVEFSTRRFAPLLHDESSLHTLPLNVFPVN